MKELIDRVIHYRDRKKVRENILAELKIINDGIDTLIIERQKSGSDAYAILPELRSRCTDLYNGLYQQYNFGKELEKEMARALYRILIFSPNAIAKTES